MRATALGLLLVVITAVSHTQTSPPFDVVIVNGRVVDGTGSPWYAADVGIRSGRIAAIGRLADAPATRRIDAHGLVVAPGFIDMLGQSELTALVNPHLPSKIFQGITTADVQRVARTYFRPENRLVLTIMPSGKAGGQ